MVLSLVPCVVNEFVITSELRERLKQSEVMHNAEIGSKLGTACSGVDRVAHWSALLSVQILELFRRWLQATLSAQRCVPVFDQFLMLLACVDAARLDALCGGHVQPASHR